MKNKLCYILLGVLMCFSFMGNVFAVTTSNLDFTVTATPDATTVVKGNEVTITLNLKSDSPIEMCGFQVTSDSTLEYVDWNEKNLWQIYSGAISDFTIANDVDTTTPLTNGENILGIKYKVNGDGKVTIKTVNCSYVIDSDNALEGTYEDVVVNITAKDLSEDYTLSDLKVTNGTLLTPITTPTDNNQYMIKLNSSTFGLKATASNEDYQDKIVFKDANGNVISDESNITHVGDGGQTTMKMTITVNEQMTYVLFIEYYNPDLDNSLKSITIDGVELPLTEGQDDYEYTIGKDVTSFEVSAVLSDSTNFKFSDNGNVQGTGTFTINDVTYVNIVIVPVSSDIGGESRSYNIIVTKEGSVVEDPSEDDGDGQSSTGGSSSSSSSSSSGNVSSNPTTGDISMFFMAFILIASLVGSIILYQKNLENYK